MINNDSVLAWINEMKSLLNPFNIVWINGTEFQNKELKEQALNEGILIKLNEELMPNCYLHRSSPNDVARVEDRTFICSNTEDEAGPTNNWIDPYKALNLLLEISKNSFKNKTMYIIPFCMGPIESNFTKLGLQITDSLYVVLNMTVMTRVNDRVFKQFENKNCKWTKCLHASCENDPKNRYICHFPQKNMVFSVNSNYGGNALLGKKCLALRIGSVMGKNEGWLAEHMLILGIKTPYNSEIKYICASFPSGCGKTNLAMIDIPESYKKNGYKVFCVGDDIAWLRIGDDNKLYAVNAENGFFGICSGTDSYTNPNALITAQKNAIFTNVAYDEDKKTVWWDGFSDVKPNNLIDWKGNPANFKSLPYHQNSRFTAPLKNCPIISDEFNSPKGVPISAIIFGGKRKNLMPLVFETFNWEHGVFIGSILASETTHAISGEVGNLRRDPFSMLPFCGYNMAQYFKHWLSIGEKLGENAPKIFNVNWFKEDENSNLLWPGFSQNIRVLDWIIKRCENKLDTKDFKIGKVPFEQDINLNDLNLKSSTIKELFSFDDKSWQQEKILIKDFYNKFKGEIPNLFYDFL